MIVIDTSALMAHKETLRRSHPCPRRALPHVPVSLTYTAAFDKVRISGFQKRKGRNLTRVCPPCIAPAQNIETTPFATPCALSAPRRNGKVVVWRQIGTDVGGWQTEGAPVPRVGREIDWVLAVGLTVPSITDAIDTRSFCRPVSSSCVERECGYGGAKAYRRCCLVCRDRGLHRSCCLVRHR